MSARLVRMVDGPHEGVVLKVNSSLITFPTLAEHDNCGATHVRTDEYVVVSESEARWSRSFTSLNLPEMGL